MRIVVTGASGALGRAFVGLCTEAGHTVAAIDIDHRDDGGDGVVHLQCGDLAEATAAQQVIAAAAQRLGGIDALVHLAGGFVWLPTLSSDVAAWREMATMNLETALCSVQAAVPHMAAGASIVCIGAASAMPAAAGMAVYGASKSAVARMVESLGAELQAQRIRINGVMPSVLDTPRNRADMPDADWSQWTSTRAVADTILFLCSDASRAINGAMIPVTNAA